MLKELEAYRNSWHFRYIQKFHRCLKKINTRKDSERKLHTKLTFFLGGGVTFLLFIGPGPSEFLVFIKCIEEAEGEEK